MLALTLKTKTKSTSIKNYRNCLDIWKFGLMKTKTSKPSKIDINTQTSSTKSSEGNSFQADSTFHQPAFNSMLTISTRNMTYMNSSVTYFTPFNGSQRNLHGICGGCMSLVISVDVRPYFMGIAHWIIPTTNTTQNFTIAWKKWNRTQRTLNNKQFNMHITEYEDK